MFEAQYLFKGAAAYTVYSPWMRRGGDNAIFGMEIIAISASTGLTVTVFAKENEDAGDGTGVTLTVNGSPTSWYQTAVGRSTIDCIGQMEDMVRYKFAIEASNATDFAMFRMLDAKWFDTVKAS